MTCHLYMFVHIWAQNQHIQGVSWACSCWASLDGSMSSCVIVLLMSTHSTARGKNSQWVVNQWYGTKNNVALYIYIYKIIQYDVIWNNRCWYFLFRGRRKKTCSQKNPSKVQNFWDDPPGKKTQFAIENGHWICWFTYETGDFPRQCSFTRG